MINSKNSLLLHSKMIVSLIFEMLPPPAASLRKSPLTATSESQSPVLLEFAGRCDPDNLGLRGDCRISEIGIPAMTGLEWLWGSQTAVWNEGRIQFWWDAELYDGGTADQDYADFGIDVRQNSQVLLCPYIYFIVLRIYIALFNLD